MPSNSEAVVLQEHLVKVFHFFNGRTTPGKVMYRLPARMPLTLDVVVTGTATINVYRSNTTDDLDNVAAWGAPLLQLTTGTKKVIENEPWENWMIEITAVTGNVSAAMGV